MKKVTIRYCIPNYLEKACREAILKVINSIKFKSIVIEVEEIGGNTDE